MKNITRPKRFYYLATFFGIFVIFLYGPMFTIVTLSFQGPQGGLTFPMNGISTFWFERLWEGVGVIDIWRGFRRSIYLGLVVMMLTVIFSLLAGLAFRKRFFGESFLFFVVVSSLIMPSIVVSLKRHLPVLKFPRLRGAHLCVAAAGLFSVVAILAGP